MSEREIEVNEDLGSVKFITINGEHHLAWPFNRELFKQWREQLK